MIGFLDQLATRNLDEASLAVRPRLPGRFESESAGSPAMADQDDHVEPTFSSSPDGARATLKPQSAAVQHNGPTSIDKQQRPNDSSVPLPLTVASRIESPRLDAEPEFGPQRVERRDTEDSTASLSRRLDQIDLHLQRTLGVSAARLRPQAKALPAVGDSTTNEPRGLAASMNHEHHESHQHFHRHETLEQITNLMNDATKTNTAAHPARLQPSTLPQVIIERQTGSAERSANTTTARRQAPPVPRIIVENTPVTQAEKHTVTVTIGRIEVRPPQKAAAPPPKPTPLAPRIMTLDDYMRRRAGGVG